jgi:hypothetical protein
VLLAAVAHTLAGGGAPSPLFCVVAAALATPVAMLVAGPRARAWRTAAAVAASQAVFHGAFTLLGDLGRWEASSSGHLHTAHLPLASPENIAPLDASMIAAHAAAALVSALVVLRGERAVVAVWRWVREHLIPARPGVRQPLLPRIPAAPLRNVPRTVRVVTQPLTRRGPPFLSAVL